MLKKKMCIIGSVFLLVTMISFAFIKKPSFNVIYKESEALMILKNNPNDFSALKSMVIQASIKGNRKDEISYLKKIAKLYPEDRSSRYYLAMRLLQDKDEKGISILRDLSKTKDLEGIASKKFLEKNHFKDNL